jgi:hypothetical protein
MSTYEKIASVAAGILIVCMIIFSYHEIKEPPEHDSGTSDFDQSVGQDFKIGNFSTVVSEQSSGGPEDACEPLQPVIIAALHDIKEHLETQKISNYSNGTGDIFEINEPTLTLLCNKYVQIILADSAGNKLLLQKIPFMRAIPPQGNPIDIGTEVRINATFTPLGSPTPSDPTTYGDILIPDRFLDIATSTQQ